MTSVLNIALGGMHRNQRAVEVSARNVANVNTDGYRALRYNPRTNTTTPRYEPRDDAGTPDPDAVPPSDVDLATEFVAIKQSEIGYRANAAVILVADRMAGDLLDLLA